MPGQPATAAMTGPRDFTLNRGCALEALRALWLGPYSLIDVDSTGRWWALRADGLPGVQGDDPDSLAAAIMTDFARRPVEFR